MLEYTATIKYNQIPTASTYYEFVIIRVEYARGKANM